MGIFWWAMFQGLFLIAYALAKNTRHPIPLWIAWVPTWLPVLVITVLIAIVTVANLGTR